MVPARTRPARRQGSFPRASGDGRLGPRIEEASLEFPPRERGWSLTKEQEAMFQPVSPARAGMVPKRSSMITLSRRFPRASGDGPGMAAACGLPVSFPPRERGWSRGDAVCAGLRAVSPARAGMVPTRAALWHRLTGFPRASGDGPESEPRELRYKGFPPRERGCRQLALPERIGLMVSPARAGMQVAHHLLITGGCAAGSLSCGHNQRKKTAMQRRKNPREKAAPLPTQSTPLHTKNRNDRKSTIGNTHHSQPRHDVGSPNP